MLISARVSKWGLNRKFGVDTIENELKGNDSQTGSILKRHLMIARHASWRRQMREKREVIRVTEDLEAHRFFPFTNRVSRGIATGLSCADNVNPLIPKDKTIWVMNLKNRF